MSVRILVVTDGLEPLLCLTVIGLAERGHTVTVVGALHRSELGEADRFRLGRSIRVRTRSPRPARDVLRVAITDPRGLRVLGSTAHRQLGLGRDAWTRLAAHLPVLGHRADVVYFEAANVAAEYASVLDRLGPRMVVCTGSDVRVLPALSARLARELPGVLAGTGRIVCRSEDLACWALRRGAPPARTTVLHPAIDTTVFSPVERPPRDDGNLRLVTVGRHHWVKGYEYAVQAVALSRRAGHDVTLTIVGADEGAGDALRFAIDDLDLADAVRLAGPTDVSGVRAALARADAYVVSSVSEGVSRAAQEAMAMGLPVVTTDAGGMPELVADGEVGFVVPRRDPRALADAFDALARDPRRRAVMGERARERAAAFDSRLHLDRIEAMLTELAAMGA